MRPAGNSVRTAASTSGGAAHHSCGGPRRSVWNQGVMSAVASRVALHDMPCVACGRAPEVARRSRMCDCLGRALCVLHSHGGAIKAPDFESEIAHIDSLVEQLWENA